ncbi:MAG: lysophospholipid acyltransferase family protein [Pseudomonadales bacterium]
MTTAKNDDQPLDALALEKHIERALAVEPDDIDANNFAYKIIKRLFNPMVVGAENIPDQPCLFVGNHSLFALDGLVLGPVMHQELGRFVRPMGDKFLWSVDQIGDALVDFGAVIGHPDTCSALMNNGSDLLVFPGGAHEAVKSASDMYMLQWKQRYGFVKLAAKHGYTIMPFGMVGPDEFYGHLIEGNELLDSMLGKALIRLGVISKDTRPDMLPPLPVGAFGSLFPKPQRCYLGFGEPIDLSAFEGKKPAQKTLTKIRGQVAEEIENQLSELLLLREQNKGKDGLLRRLLTL